MRGIEALVKPGPHIRLVFDRHIPCIAQVIGQREEGQGGLCAYRARVTLLWLAFGQPSSWHRVGFDPRGAQ